MVSSNQNKMRTEKKTSVKNSLGRLVTSAIFVLLQVGWMMMIFIYLNKYFAWITLGTSIFAVYIALKIYGTSTNSSLKIPWIIVILFFPIFGLLIYGLFGRSIITKKKRDYIAQIDNSFKTNLKQDISVLKRIEEKDYRIANEFRYLSSYCGYPVYDNTEIEFYDDASKGFEAQLEALSKAERFIFMEYHAIEDAKSFNRLKKILVERVKAGVEVRMFYDDIGSIFFLNKSFIKQMRDEGIRCRVFNPIRLIFNIFMNNRDHRKITVIDGNIGFTGGYNLADEYFNITHPYGEWKDTGVKISGDAVKSLTTMFLSMWNSIKNSDEPDEDYEKYINTGINSLSNSDNSHFIAPYADNPLDGEHIGENVYLNVIKNAKKYLFITTPYLIITDEMSRELTLAAKRGVDVRIITPGIPDKKVTYGLTRSYYSDLVKHGIRIFEYTPGFMHAKQWVSDDEISVIGTINMDFRSLYHHFENALLVYGEPNARAIYNDFMHCFEKSEEVTDKYYLRPRNLKLGQCIMRLISPLF